MRRLDLGGFSIVCPEGWEDITDTLEEDDPPLTVADAEAGIGVVQFSAALYQGGPLPSPSLADLAEMVAEHAETHGWGPALAMSTFESEVSGAGAEFHVDEFVMVMWYVSDGKNFVLATYTGDWDAREAERREREEIVRSIRFG